MKQRFKELDSLRGLAALSVVFHHFLIMLPAMSDDPNAFWFLKYTPIHIFWAGHEAVIFFFVLSGFVLSLQFFRKKVCYRSYLVKRLCRIYIPCIACVIFSIGMSRLFYGGEIEGLSSWFNRVWTMKPSVLLVIEHVFLISSFRNNVFVPVLWSLVHEMRISIIFPVVMLGILRFNWKINLGFAACMTTLSMVLTFIFHRVLDYRSDYWLTVHYISMFIFGALLAKHKGELIDGYRRLARWVRISFLLIGMLCYVFPWLIRGISSFSLLFFDDWIVSAGVAVFVISSLGSSKVSQLLVLRPVIFLGLTSYSVYLLHTVVLLSLTHLFYGAISLWVIWILAFTATVFLAWLSYKFVEIPSMHIGRRLAEKF